MAGTEPVDDSFLDEVDDSFLDEVDEPAGDVNRIDLNAPEEKRKPLYEALGDAAKWLTDTEVDALLGAVQGGTLESAPLLSRMFSMAPENRRAADQPYRDAAKRSPWAHGAGRVLGGLPAAMALTKGGFVKGTAKGGALGGVMGFLGSESGADAPTLGEEFSGENLTGKFADAGKGAGLAAVMGGLGYGAGKGVNKLLQMFGPKAGAAVASGADDVATRADDFLSQMNDAAPDSVADDVIESL